MPPLSSTLNNVPLDVSGFFSSETIEIVAESGQKRFFTHSDVLARKSEIFRLTAGVCGEAAKKIELPDWDGATVQRLVQFLYFGDYQYPEPVLEGEGVVGGGEGKDGEEDGEDERESRVNTPDTLQSRADQEELGNMDANDSILLIHAKLYALAQYMDVGALETMALGRLRTALDRIDDICLGVPRRWRDVIELLEYVYSHTGTDAYPYMVPRTDSDTESGDGTEADSGSGAGSYSDSHTVSHADSNTESEAQSDTESETGDPMRDLVSTFAAKNFVKLASQAEMVLLLSEGGEIVLDLMEKVAGRLCFVECPSTADNTCDMESCNIGKLNGMRREIQYWESQATASDEKIRQLKITHAAEIRQQETASLEKIRQLDASSAEKIQNLETINAELQQSEIDNTEKIRELEVAMETKVLESEVVNEEMQELKVTSVRLVQELEDKVGQLERKLRWFETACPEKAQEYASGREFWAATCAAFGLRDYS